MRAKMFYYAVETRFSNQSFLPSMSCSVYKANDDRIYFKCFPLVLAVCLATAILVKRRTIETNTGRFP